MAEDIVEYRAWMREQTFGGRRSWKEMEEERQQRALLQKQLDEQNKLFHSRCKPFSWVEYYKQQPAPDDKPACEGVDVYEARESSNMMEYLGLRESDFFSA